MLSQVPGEVGSVHQAITTRGPRGADLTGVDQAPDRVRAHSHHFGDLADAIFGHRQQSSHCWATGPGKLSTAEAESRLARPVFSHMNTRRRALEISQAGMDLARALLPDHHLGRLEDHGDLIAFGEVQALAGALRYRCNYRSALDGNLDLGHHSSGLDVGYPALELITRA